MRLIRCGLPRYRTLQQQWRLTAALGGATAFPRVCQTRGVWLPPRIIHQNSSFVESFFSARSPHKIQSTESLEETKQDILARARAYNILTVDQIDFESDVVHNPNRRGYVCGVRLIDRQPYREDFYLWTILLDWQKLQFGDKGIRSIWEGLKFRCRKVNLPFTGYQGDRLWSAFVSAGTRNHRFLEEVIRYELRKGGHRPHFFWEVVGALLESKSPSSAKSFARMLQGRHRPSKEELFDLFVLASTAKTATVLQLFCDIYLGLPLATLYGKSISYLCAEERFSDAWMMHRYLLSREDLPQTFEEVKPLVVDLVNHNMRLESLLHELAKAGISMEAQARTFYAQERSLRLGFSSENLNIVSSKTLGVQPRSLSDSFVASAFLTATFSFDSILGGLRFFGLKAVGPSSIRAMGLTSADSQELMVRFAKLSDLEIDTGSSRFSRTVKKLAQEGQEQLLQNVLRSDQHADCFEDLNLQRRLLLKYYRDEDWDSVNRTLVILTVGSSGDIARENAANLLLRTALSAHKWSHVRRIMAEMSRDGHRFHESSIARMYRTILSKREPASRPVVQKDFDDLGFLVSIWLGVIRSGTMIPAARWREPIRRLGMCGRLDDLESLLTKLLQCYGKGRTPQTTIGGHTGNEEVKQLLSPALQSAIVAWGFIHTRHLKPVLKSGSPFGGSIQHPWIRGIAFLRSLKDRHGCNIDLAVVQRACLLRLCQLFHHQSESILHRNRRSMSRNRLPLWLYVEALENAWSEPLLDKQQLWKAVTTQAPVGLRHRRRVSLRRQLGRHFKNRNASPAAAFNGKQKEYRQETLQQNAPTDFVIHGGPLSQAYWSSR